MKHQTYFDQLESKELEQAFLTPAMTKSSGTTKEDEEADEAIKKYLNSDDSVAVEEQKVQHEEYPSHQWFLRFRETLLLQNIKVSILHTYSKAMQFRQTIMTQDPGNQIVNIDEDQLAAFLSKFSLKGLLPQMPKILVTTYKGNQSIDTWLISYVWTLVFVFEQEFKVFEPRFFKLFGVQH
jgi:hypothetical protein